MHAPPINKKASILPNHIHEIKGDGGRLLRDMIGCHGASLGEITDAVACSATR